MANNHAKFQSLRAQIDMLYNLVLCFVTMFFFAILISNPITQKQGDIITKAEFMIEVSWDPDMDNDVDSWLRTPSGTLISYRSPDKELFHLERDDLGWSNDTVQILNGKTIVLKENKEVVMFRGYYEGMYTFNIMMFNMRNKNPTKVHIKITKLNPYSVIGETDLILTKEGQELTAFNFRIDSHGFVNYVDNKFTPIIFRETLSGTQQ